MTACIYAPKEQTGSYPGAKTEPKSQISKVGELESLRIHFDGETPLRTFLNGEPFVDYTAWRSMIQSDRIAVARRATTLKINSGMSAVK